MSTKASRRAMISALALFHAGLTFPTRAADDLDGSYMARIPTWTGIHVGVGGGYGAALHEITGAVVDLDHSGDAGSLLTAEAGFDFQAAERLIFGVLGDYSWTKFDSNHDNASGVELENMWTVAGRLGFLSRPHTMWYGLVGWTHTDVDSPAGNQNDELEGITLGLGIESRLTDALSFKLEYRYTDFDNLSVGGGRDYSGADDISGESADIATQFDTTVQTVRGVLSWRFRAASSPRAGTDAHLRSGCAKVLRAPSQHGRETVELCELANSL